MYIRNWEYEKWIDLLIKQREIIDTIAEKKTFSLLETIVYLSISNVNYEAMKYILENYPNLPNNLLGKLLNELNKPIRKWIVKEAFKSEYKYLDYHFKEKTILSEIIKYKLKRSISNIFKSKIWRLDLYPQPTLNGIEEKTKYFLIKLWLILLYSENETRAINKEFYYNLIEYNNVDNTILYQKITIKDFKKSMLKNLNNYIWRRLLVENLINIQWYQEEEEMNLQQRQSLIQILQEKIGEF
jgi:hypothetical protein